MIKSRYVNERGYMIEKADMMGRFDRIERGLMKAGKNRQTELQAPMGETTVLLHTCCAPCSSAIIEAMMHNGITPVIYYCNPNIYPREEYEIRKNECTRYAQSLGLEIIDADYDHENWLEAVKGMEGEPERGGRCLKCFKLRLLRTAQYARERGIKVIATTLASSRWKSLDQINEAGLWACQTISSGKFRVFPDKGTESGSLSGNVQDVPDKEQDSVCLSGKRQENTDADMIQSEVIWWDYNWRKGGLQERRLQIIREYDFYNQLYCGCEFSMRKED